MNWSVKGVRRISCILSMQLCLGQNNWNLMVYEVHAAIYKDIYHKFLLSARKNFQLHKLLMNFVHAHALILRRICKQCAKTDW